MDKFLKMFIKRLLRTFALNSQIKPHSHFKNNVSIIPKFSNFKKQFSSRTEFESIKKALDANNERKALADHDGSLKTEKRLLIGFTCKKCQNRTHSTMSHHAYHHGIVLIECSGCQSRHLIADNLGWFKDTPNAARKIEEMTKEVGEIRRKLNLNEEDALKLIEVLK